MDNDNNILFDRFLKEELSVSEKNDFEARLASDADFQKDYEMFLSLVAGVKATGKADILADINEASANAKPKAYKPPSSGGFGIFQLFTAFILAAIAGSILLYSDVIPSKNEKVLDAKEWLHQWDDQLYKIMRTDTIYDTIYQYVPIQDENIEVGDTIYSN